MQYRCQVARLHRTQVQHRYSPSENQGKILGLNQSFASLARVLGPLWGGFAFQYLGYEAPFITGALFTFVTLLFSFYMFFSTKNKFNFDV